MTFRRYIPLAAVVLLLILVGPASPAESENWRCSYYGKALAHNALRDFDEAALRIGDLLDRLERSGDLTASGKEEINAFVEQIEQEYLGRWFGGEGKYKGCGMATATSTGTHNNYDSSFREQTRSVRQNYGKAPGADTPENRTPPRTFCHDPASTLLFITTKLEVTHAQAHGPVFDMSAAAADRQRDGG